MKIAVYAIALNEIKHCERFVKACQGADYIVVADTGSSDGTPEELERLGATVHRISVKPWRFDTARNAALALVPADADICVTLDLDEVPQKNFFSQIRKHWVAEADHGWILFDTGSQWEKDKIHTRWGWQWKYTIHEVAVFYGEDRATRFCKIPNALVKHEPDTTKSRGMYLPMLELDVKEHPDDPRSWTYMTREYYFHQKWEDVLRAGQRTLELKDKAWDVEQAAVCKWLAEAAFHLKKPEEEVTAWYRKGVEILPNQGEPWYGVAIDAYRRKDWNECLSASVNILELPRSVHYCYEAAIWDWKAYDLAAVSAFNLGHYKEALSFAQEAAKANGPEQERILKNIKFMKEKLKK